MFRNEKLSRLLHGAAIDLFLTETDPTRGDGIEQGMLDLLLSKLFHTQVSDATPLLPHLGKVSTSAVLLLAELS